MKHYFIDNVILSPAGPFVIASEPRWRAWQSSFLFCKYLHVFSNPAEALSTPSKGVSSSLFRLRKDFVQLIFFFIFCSLLFSPLSFAQSPQTLKLKLFSGQELKEVYIMTEGACCFEILSFEAGQLFWKKKPVQGPLTFVGLTKIRHPEAGQKNVVGKTTIQVVRNGFAIQAEVGLENYVQSVLASELPADTPLEALKAVSIAIRTYAIRFQDRHEAQGFDLCDLTHCQVYGALVRDPIYRRATQATQHKILTYQGEPAVTLYHSVCGGMTSPNQAVFSGKPLPYLQGVDDQGACSQAENFQWQRDVYPREIQKLQALGIHFEKLKIAQGSNKGRIYSFYQEDKNHQEWLASELLSLIGKNLGWALFKSTWFKWEFKGDHLMLEGKGFGHGVGLCEAGASHFAKRGWNYEKILQFYYPGTQLLKR